MWLVNLKSAHWNSITSRSRWKYTKTFRTKTVIDCRISWALSNVHFYLDLLSQSRDISNRLRQFWPEFGEQNQDQEGCDAQGDKCGEAFDVFESTAIWSVGRLLGFKWFLNDQMFPFSFGLDKDLKINYVGIVFGNLFGNTINGAELTSVLRMIRPGGIMPNWNTVFRLRLLIFHRFQFIQNYQTKRKIIQNSMSVVYEFENIMPLKRRAADETKVRLKGQMKMIKELNLIFFLGHPM